MAKCPFSEDLSCMDCRLHAEGELCPITKLAELHEIKNMIVDMQADLHSIWQSIQERH